MGKNPHLNEPLQALLGWLDFWEPPKPTLIIHVRAAISIISENEHVVTIAELWDRWGRPMTPIAQMTLALLET